jgi:hypothetical protein
LSLTLGLAVVTLLGFSESKPLDPLYIRFALDNPVNINSRKMYGIWVNLAIFLADT